MKNNPQQHSYKLSINNAQLAHIIAALKLLPADENPIDNTLHGLCI